MGISRNRLTNLRRWILVLSVRRQTEWDKSGAGLMDTFPY
jgi:hypothetical protein